MIGSSVIGSCAVGARMEDEELGLGVDWNMKLQERRGVML